MNFQEFCTWIAEQLQTYYGEGAQIELRQFRKNNGCMLTGLVIMEPKANVMPTIFLEEYFSIYENGIPPEEVLERIIGVYEANKIDESVDFSYFRDYEKVRERIVCKLIGREENEELLKEIPWAPVLDLALVFYYILPDNAFAKGTILIRKSHLEAWKIEQEQLLEQAKANTERLNPPLLQDMETILREWLCPAQTENNPAFIEEAEKAEEEEQEQKQMPAEDETELCKPKAAMHVLTNQERVFGAVCILYDGLLRKLAESWDSDIFILPSSVHECILLPEKEGFIQKELVEMVCQVNKTQLKQEERLSNKVYYYSRSRDEILFEKE